MDEQVHKTEEPKVEAKPTAAHGNRTLMACLAYVLFVIPMITGDSKRDDFVKYHTKQGFALFIVWFALGVIVWAIPFIAWNPLVSLINLCVLVLFIIGIVNAANGKKQPLPVIGRMGDWLKI
jgi:Predicted membrane protein